MDTRGTVTEAAAADHVIHIFVTDNQVKINVLKSRDGDFVLAPDDPRLASLKAAVLRYVDGDVA